MSLVEIYLPLQSTICQKYLKNICCWGNFVTMSTGNYASNSLITRLIQMTFAGYIQ